MSNYTPTPGRQQALQTQREAVMPDYCQVIHYRLIQRPGGEEDKVPEVIEQYPCTFDAQRSEEVILPSGTRILTTGAFYLPVRAYGIIKSIHAIRLIRQGDRVLDPPLEIPVVGEPKPTLTQLVVHVRGKG